MTDEQHSQTLIIERVYEPDPDREREAVRALARLHRLRRREPERQEPAEVAE